MKDLPVGGLPEGEQMHAEHFRSNDRKRFEWPFGRIIELYPGKDNQVGAVEVETPIGVLVRSL